MLSKKALSLALAGSLVFPVGSAFASEEPTNLNEQISQYSPELKKELQQAEIDTKTAAQKVNEINQEELNKELEELKSNNPEKYQAIIKEKEKQKQKFAASSGKMGTKGDILISYDNKTAGWNHGHAAIVLEDNNYYMEAWPDRGVRVHDNDFGTRFNSKKKQYIKGASNNQYRAAQNYAYSKKGSKYSVLTRKDNPYQFYCSSLVWQAWKSQGYDLDSNGGGIVTPADIDNSSYTITY
ncbi:YiiX/YebB-like N1pC/P60 family cysteine hydrolase [Bacillus pretiosus]